MSLVQGTVLCTNPIRQLTYAEIGSASGWYKEPSPVPTPVLTYNIY